MRTHHGCDAVNVIATRPRKRLYSLMEIAGILTYPHLRETFPRQIDAVVIVEQEDSSSGSDACLFRRCIPAMFEL